MADAAGTSTAAAVVTAATHSQEARGGGGKLRREKKPPTTPYDRRPSGGRWVSKIVDPAKRLFSGLPSLFSSNLADEVHTQTEDEAGIAEEEFSLDPVVSDSTGGFAPNEDKGKSKVVIIDEDGRDKRQSCSNAGVPDLEQLIKGKTFSREEIDRLMKILHTRVVDVEQDRKTPNMRENEFEGVITSNRKSESSLVEEELNKFQQAASTSLRPAEDIIGASPVDIAKAYMSGRASEMGFTSARPMQKYEKMGLSSDYISNSVMRSPLRKASLCWPGAVTHNQEDYGTSPSLNNRSGGLNFARTPYSRTVYSKTKSRLNPLRGNNKRIPSISPAPFQPTATPVYEKFTNNVAGSSYGTGGPIRRNQNRLTLGTPTRNSPLFSTARRSPLASESSPMHLSKKTFELGSLSNSNNDLTNSKAESLEARVHSVHPQSNRLAWKILEQLDRPVTLKEQSKELSLAVSQHNISVPKSSSPSMAVVGVGECNSMDTVVDCGHTTGESNDFHREGSDTAIISVDKTGSVFGVDSGPSSILGKQDSQRSSEQGTCNAPQPFLLFGDPSRGAAAVNNNAPRSESRNSKRKPILPSIAVEKSGFTTSFSSITSSNFTFPVTTSSTSFAEPPTPSIIPSALINSPPQPKGSIPTSNSGNKITIAPPVVAFSSKIAFQQNNVLAPKFKFDSDKQRLCFSVPGDDTSAPNDACIPKFTFKSGESRLNFGTIAPNPLCC